MEVQIIMSYKSYAALLARMHALEDPAYRSFMSRLIPGCENLRGIRMPALRRLAKEIARSDYRRYMAEAREDTYEETLLQGLVIGACPAPFEEVCAYTRSFIPKITNWAVNDSFCSSLAITKSHKSEMWEFLQPYFFSERPYELRFAVVMGLCYYKEAADLVQIFPLLDRIRSEEYYVRMAVAWALSIYYVSHPDITSAYLHSCSLDSFTYGKTLQKILESRRLTPAMRKDVLELRKRERKQI